MLRLYNSLSRKVETFKPLHDLQVGIYTCGPTVYDFAHIGNFRTYTTSDILVRTLLYSGYEVKYIMNLTDVGHLTGDNLGDADTGEDRLEKSAKKEGKTAWEVALFYTDAFLKDYEALNLTQPAHFTKATDHIKEQIDLVKRLEEKGYTYQISDGIYFDTQRFKNYGALSNLDQIKEGARVEVNPEKKNPRDFALWKFSYPNWRSFADAQDDRESKRHMEWESPWGVGFPGWHIECSAMAMKYLGESFDIHVGGVDLRETHHPNEIAQAEAATGKKFVNYWLHSAFMLVSGQRMSKSLGNNYKLYDLEQEGYDPLSLRYLYLQTHYRQEMNFSFASLDAAANALKSLRETLSKFPSPTHVSKKFSDLFLDALNDDLNTPKALAIMWEMLKSDLPDDIKHATVLKMDQVLGLQFDQVVKEATLALDQLPRPVRSLILQREEMRKARQFAQADQVRNQIKKMGYDIQDSEDGIKIKKT